MPATLPVSHAVSIPAPRLQPRRVLLVSADASFRQRLQAILTGLRWQVREAETGAQAWAEAEGFRPGAVCVDGWLPDLDSAEFSREFRVSYPEADLIGGDGTSLGEGPRSPYRQEILLALRSSQETETASWQAAPVLEGGGDLEREGRKPPATVRPDRSREAEEWTPPAGPMLVAVPPRKPAAAEKLPELVGNAECMIEVSRRVRLVAPRTTPVLIEGPTGSGKELVAEALHRLSSRNRKPFIVLNCAAIPEALLEAELFGHTRGAFTGAVQGRVGRIEAADGGTLFLDEIGEMPLALQSKLLRFVECGELQRVGDNETVKVDVRILAATHRSLAKHTKEGTFRSDLYYRLAVFLIRTPALVDHIEDLPLLVEHFLDQMGRSEPRKRLHAAAVAMLEQHGWPGNVRELEHVLERAAILAGESTTITEREIDFA